MQVDDSSRVNWLLHAPSGMRSVLSFAADRQINLSRPVVRSADQVCRAAAEHPGPPAGSRGESRMTVDAGLGKAPGWHYWLHAGVKGGSFARIQEPEGEKEGAGGYGQAGWGGVCAVCGFVHGGVYRWPRARVDLAASATKHKS